MDKRERESTQRDGYISKQLFGGEDTWYLHHRLDHTAAFEMEEKIKERGWQDQYAKWVLFFVSKEIPYTGHLPTFEIVHASPDLRAQACYQMLKAMEGK